MREVDLPQTEGVPELVRSSFAECGYAHYALGLCVAHYAMRPGGDGRRGWHGVRSGAK